MALMWLYLLLIPAPAIIETTHAGGQIYFSANRGVVFLPSDCVILRWQVDHILDVYLNDQPQIGSGESHMCVTGTAPSLTVKFQDGSQRTYDLHIDILSTSPLTWGLVALTIISLITHRKSVRQIIQRPVHFLALTVVLLAILYLIFGQMIPSSEMVASAEWLDATNALASLIRDSALLLLCVVILTAIVRDALCLSISAQPSSHRRLVATWGIGLALSLSIIAGTIIAINPLGMYFASLYPSYQLLLRGVKTDGYNHLSPAPDIAIMGSSRAFTLAPTYIEQKTGYTAYNMSVEGGRIEDLLIQARQMQRLPKVMFIEVQEGLPRQPNDIAARAPLSWLPYMSTSTALLTIQKRLEGLLDMNQFAESIYTAHYATLYKYMPKEWPDFEPDGVALRPPVSASDLQQAILLDIGNIPAVHCDRVNEISQADVDELIRVTEAHHTALVFYLSPWHPQYYVSLLKNDPKFQECHSLFAAYMMGLSKTHRTVFFLDFSPLESIDGTADETGFYDSQHLTAANSQRLIDHAAETLRVAYLAAAQGG